MEYLQARRITTFFANQAQQKAYTMRAAFEFTLRIYVNSTYFDSR